MKKMNKKGFTLVELLAVIVVLAIIMVIAVPSVITAMNSAKQTAFIVYAEKMLNTAQQQYQTDSLVKVMPTKYCYNVSKLTESGSTQYQGYVVVEYNAATKKSDYKVIMFDKSYSIGITTDTTLGDKTGGVTFNELEAIKANLASDTLSDPPTTNTKIDSPCGTTEESKKLTSGDVQITA